MVGPIVTNPQEPLQSAFEEYRWGSFVNRGKRGIAGVPGSVGYVGLGYVDETVKGVSIDVEGTADAPSIETVLSGEYTISRTLYMITNGEPQSLALDYIAFVLSDEGQTIVEEEGFVPLTAENMTEETMVEETGMASA